MNFIRSILCCHSRKNSLVEVYVITQKDVYNAIDNFFNLNAPNVKYSITWNTDRLPCTITYLLNSIFDNLRNNTKKIDININIDMICIIFDENPFQEVQLFFNNL